jgi:hypothetical protein
MALSLSSRLGISKPRAISGTFVNTLILRDLSVGLGGRLGLPRQSMPGAHGQSLPRGNPPARAGAAARIAGRGSFRRAKIAAARRSRIPRRHGFPKDQSDIG